ncbi:MAG TPA: glycerophosphoryl diester phosphodiesterase membrane domain-containing protein [Dermatophilaceae bacterium]|nr:glycerophosphoryl diester phosphodiesterase membrane domain-containing protein [Dermatophilaceae bacterium]
MSGFGPPPGATEAETRARPASYLPPGGLTRGLEPAAYQRYALPTLAKPGIVPLRPLSLGELIDGATRHVRRNPGPVLGAAAIANAVAAIPLLIAVGVAVAGPLFSALGVNRVFDSGLLTVSLSFGGSGLAVLLLGASLSESLGQAVLGRRLDLSAIWRSVRPRIWAILGVCAVLSLVAIGPSTLLVLAMALLSTAPVPVILILGMLLSVGAAVGTLWLLPRLLFALPAVVLEGLGVRAALRRGWQLSRTRYWTIIGVALLGLGIVLPVYWFLQLPIWGLLALLTDLLELSRPLRTSLSPFLFTLANLAAATLVTPFLAGLLLLLYLDARIRLEGFDLALIRAAAARGASR